MMPLITVSAVAVEPAQGTGQTQAEQVLLARWSLEQGEDGAWPADPKTDFQVRLANTALVVNSLLRLGYDHQTPNKHRWVLRQAIDWLRVAERDESGIWSERVRIQALVIIALAEAYAMTSDERLKEPIIRGAHELTQMRTSVLFDDVELTGWPRATGQSELSVDDSAFAALALDVAVSAGLEVDGLAAARAVWLVRHVWPRRNQLGLEHNGFPSQLIWDQQGNIQASGDGTIAAGLLLGIGGNQFGDVVYDDVMLAVSDRLMHFDPSRSGSQGWSPHQRWFGAMATEIQGSGFSFWRDCFEDWLSEQMIKRDAHFEQQQNPAGLIWVQACDLLAMSEVWLHHQVMSLQQ